MNKDKLIEKLFSTPITKTFTTRDLDKLMKSCGCEKFQGGRGSGIKYFHISSQRALTFDAPHPGNELHPYQIKKTRIFLKDIGEYKNS